MIKQKSAHCLEIEPKRETMLKDWVLASEDFLNGMPVLPENVLLDHDVRFKDATLEDRKEFVRTGQLRNMRTSLGSLTRKKELPMHTYCW